MFMDSTATSNRLETLAKVLMAKDLPQMDEKSLKALLAPTSLTNYAPLSPNELLKAGKLIGLVTYCKDTKLINKISSDGKNAKQKLLEILDDKILSRTDIEPYFAKLYAYILFTDQELSNNEKLIEALILEVNKKFLGFDQNNQLNYTKLSSYLPWYSYFGLTQTMKQEGRNVLSEAYPYERIARKLNNIFNSKQELLIDEFMQNLGSNCPELDCGEILMLLIRQIIKQANR